MAIILTGVDIPKTCGECPLCIFSAAEKRCIGFYNTSDEDYYCKALERFMEYDEVEDGVAILGKPDDCPLKTILYSDDCISRDAACKIFATDLSKPDKKVSYQGMCVDAVFKIIELPSVKPIRPSEK